MFKDRDNQPTSSSRGNGFSGGTLQADANAGSIGGAAPSLSLPKGGGAIRGIGEKFAMNPASGTGTMTLPIVTSPGRSGFGPQLSLSYDSGAGNGPFGFGWNISLASITRKTDKGLPRYVDGDDSDVFILAGAEDLVPVLKKDPQGRMVVDEEPRNGHLVRRYRPRIENLFARIERWTRLSDGDTHWRSISKDNITTRYGKSPESRISDPNRPNHVFSWLICESYDDKGNAIVYEYKPEDSKRLDSSQLHEQNRNDVSRSANRYLKRVRYGNRQPNRDVDWKPTDPAQLPKATWMFEVVFDYGEGHYAEQQPNLEQRVFAGAQIEPPAGSQWPARQDPFSTYRAGFEVRTYRLCRRALMFHHFPAELGIDDYLVRSTEFTYFESPGSSFIKSVTQSGYVRQPIENQPNRYLKKSLPALEFDYSQVPGPEALAEIPIREFDRESLENLPAGLNDAGYQWIDLDGEGISSILTEQGNSWYYKRNLSANNLVRENGRDRAVVHFDSTELVASKPATALRDAGQFLDLAGDGQVDLVHMEGPLRGFYERTDSWAQFQSFISWPDVNTRDPNLKFVDLTGDGHADILITRGDSLVWYPSLAEEGFGPPFSVELPFEEEQGPRLVFADGTQSTYLADLSGDGLSDLVRIGNGEVCYWPNLGYGRFGAMVMMDHAPWFDSSDQFDQRRIRLADTDGSGPTDILYLGRAGVQIYFNQGGNRWSDAVVLKQFPAVDNISSVEAIDLLGNGTACLVWSSSLPAAAGHQMRYLSLMTEKPHLLVGMKNNLGAETQVHYAPSTKFYLDDKRDGKPWITRIPFPVHVVERVETFDQISHNRFVTQYKYHHGYFDGVEREFRGFGMVEQRDTEEFAAFSDDRAPRDVANSDAASHVPPVLTRTWFHTGIYMDRDHVSDFFAGLLDAVDQGEYYREPGLTDEEARAQLLPDTVLPSGLTPEEEREACRALRGMMLRQEVYADDVPAGASEAAIRRSKTPYTVVEQNFTIRSLQPRAGNRHAVFFTHPREAITYHYERNQIDARIQQSLTLEVEDFGNVLKSATIGIGRRRTIRVVDEQGGIREVANPELNALDPRDREKQIRTLVTYTENRLTAPIDDIAVHPDDYRAPLPAEARTYELTGYTSTGTASRFQASDFVKPDAADVKKLVQIFDNEIPYEQQPAGGKQRRLIEHQRTLYRKDDLSELLPLGELEPLALTGESYRLALTPGLFAEVFARDGDALLPNPAEILAGQGADRGGYVDLNRDGNWWVPSGRVFLSPNNNDTREQERASANQHFFLPHRYQDPFHTAAVRTENVVTYDVHNLLTIETRDALGNVTTVNTQDDDGATAIRNDYRVLQPYWITDPNRNRTRVTFDALGMVVATALMGKPGENKGDNLIDFEADLTQAQVDAFHDAQAPHSLAASLLKGASTRIIYDAHRFRISQRTHPDDPARWEPPYWTMLARETHASDTLPPQGMKIQISFSHSDGFGREIQKKIQAEPGPAPRRDVDGKIIVGANGLPLMTANDVNPRWVGSGWTVFNNKGKPARQFEPFFTDTHHFEFDVRIGVSSVLFYDPVDRMVATLQPNHTYDKVVFDPWQQKTYDVNDTVALDPRNDPDIAGFVKEYFKKVAPRAEDWQTWLQLSGVNPLAPPADTSALAPEKKAAVRTLRHAGTSTVVNFDSLGRTFLTMAHNKFERKGPDGASEIIEEKYATRVELDIEGNPRSIRDAVVQNDDQQGRVVIRYHYDMLGNGMRQASIEAGERWTLNDVTGKPIRAWDSRRFMRRMVYDELRRLTRLFVTEGNSERLAERTVYGESEGDAKNHRTRVHQTFDDAGIVTNIAYDYKGNVLESRRDLLPEYKLAVDWLQNPTANDGSFTTRTTHDALNRPIALTTPDKSVYRPSFNEANLLNKVDLNLRDLATATPFVTNIEYNAKGQRTLIQYANGAKTTYEYDQQTFRLTNLKTTRVPGQNGLASQIFKNAETVQDLHYTYDPVGNIIRIADDALPAITNNNQLVSAVCEYTHDAVYRLIEATGREHIGQTTFAPDPLNRNFRDHPFVGPDANPNDLRAVRNYIERYEYDVVGNPGKIIHEAADGNWRRTFAYEEASLLEPTKRSNRLSSTGLGQLTETYTHDAHGNMTRMPHLTSMRWDFKDQLLATARQVVNNGTPETTFYVYDGMGQRTRKVTERQNGTRKDERIYVGGFEVYREFSGVVPRVMLERETLHVMDDKERVALVETKTIENGNTVNQPLPLQSFLLSNHLGSGSVELDQNGGLISYEEYYPYGATSYQARNSATEVSLKRYRYTGKERDEETGLNYHGARYCAPWLGRWTSVDPATPLDGVNGYTYARNNPTNRVDRDGRQSDDETKEEPAPAPTPEPEYETPPEPGAKPPAEPQKTEAPAAPSRPSSSHDDDDSPGVLGWIFNNTIGRVFDAARTAFEGVVLAAKRLVQPIFHYGPRPGAFALGIVSAAGTLLAAGLIAIGTLTFLEPVERRLTAKEIKLTRSAFGNSIDLTHVRAKEGFSLHSLFVRSPHVANYQIFGLSKDATEDVFLHEMTHIWQEQHGNPMFPRLENPSYNWEEVVAKGTPWEKLGPEQQAEVLKTAFRFERELKDWEELKKEYETKPPLPKELEKIHGPRTLPDRPNYIAGNIFTGLHDISDYLLEALRKVRAGEGAGT